jgi:hypothetical protein
MPNKRFQQTQDDGRLAAKRREALKAHPSPAPRGRHGRYNRLGRWNGPGLDGQIRGGGPSQVAAAASQYSNDGSAGSLRTSRQERKTGDQPLGFVFIFPRAKAR